MSRIGAHLSGFERQLLNYLAEANAAAAVNSLRLTTGKKVNSPSDDPAAFLDFSGQADRLSAITDTVDRVDAAADVAASMQLTLDQVRTQLDTIRSTLVAAGDQADIDAAITQINTLGATQINGRSLLNGSADFRISGMDRTQIRDLKVYSSRNASVTISGSVDVDAEQATLTYTGASGKITDAATFTLTGDRGSTTITVAVDDLLTDTADTINADSYKTGITAGVAGDVLTFTTVDYGTEATIAVDVTDGTFTVAGGNGDGTAQGVDAQVTIDGISVDAANIDGNTVTMNQNGFHYTVEFEGGFTGTFDTVTVTDEDVLNFALSPDINRNSSLAVPGIHAARLGGLSGTLDQLASGGSLADLGDNTAQAIRVVDEALGQLTLIDGRVDGFADAAVASSAALMSGLQDTLDSDGDEIIDRNEIDETEEALLLAKNQALAANALASLSILNQQRASVVAILQQIAGLI